MKKILIILLFVLFASCNSDKKLENGSISKNVNDVVSNNFTQLKKREIENRVILSGRIDVIPNDRIDVFTPYNGYVKNINIIEGDILKKGSILFEVENIELAKLQSNFIELNNSLIQIKKEFERQDELFKNNAISEKVYLEYQTTYLNHLNQILINKKELEYYGINTNNLLKTKELTNTIKIKARENVLVSKLNLNNGKYVEKNDLLVELYKTNHLHAELFSPSKYINLLEEKDSIVIIHDNGTFNGFIHRISKTVDNTSNMFKIHVHFNNNPQIAIGSFVRGEITFSKTVYSIESEAISEKNGKQFIIIYDNNKKENISIISGIKDGSYTEIINYNDLINKKIIKN